MSRQNRPALSIARIVRQMKNKQRANKIVVVVGTVTDDKRIFKVPALTVCALRFTEAARARIIKNGGKIITFEQLAVHAPLGECFYNFTLSVVPSNFQIVSKNSE